MTKQEKIGRAIKAVLKLRGMTQEELAEKANMSTQTVSMICQGKSNFRINSIKAIERELNASFIFVPNEYLDKYITEE